jgi:hypothetical protein
MTKPDEQPAPAQAELPQIAPAAPAAPGPAGPEDFAGEITVTNGPMPRWFRRLPHVVLIASLAYYVYVRAFDPVNLVFAALFIVWMIYTPIAQKRGWFFIPM